MTLHNRITPTSLAAIRTAHIERCEAAYKRILASKSPEGGLPYSLVSAGIWLVYNGYEGEACPAEKATGWGPDRYLQYIRECTPEMLDTDLADGYRALFEGSRCRPAICPAPAMRRAA